MRITFGANEVLTNSFAFRQTSNQFYQRVGAKGFSGNVAAFRAPGFRNYVYGPEVAIGGVAVNGNRVDLVNRSANFIELTLSSEIGSCPYLLSHDRREGGWIEHGKVLDKAPDKSREYTEVKVFSGLRARFRLEEREPELAFIDQAELVLVLNDGDTHLLEPDQAKLAARDGDYVRLFWGDAVEFEFALPHGVAEEQVKESQIRVTGYYLRYEDLMVDTTEPRGSTGGLRRASIPAAATANGPICPAPAALRLGAMRGL
jgi:hypothetical protein